MPAPAECLLLNAADTHQAQPEAGQSFTGDPAGCLFPALPLIPRPATASHHGGELDAVGGPSEVPDLSREGPFDIHQDHPHCVASPRLLQDTQGCPFRMTSYDEETSGPDFTPAYGVQLHDPRLLEYVGAPESAQLTSCSPEYWVHHIGRKKALSAALQLQHDAQGGASLQLHRRDSALSGRVFTVGYSSIPPYSEAVLHCSVRTTGGRALPSSGLLGGIDPIRRGDRPHCGKNFGRPLRVEGSCLGVKFQPGDRRGEPLHGSRNDCPGDRHTVSDGRSVTTSGCDRRATPSFTGSS